MPSRNILWNMSWTQPRCTLYYVLQYVPAMPSYKIKTALNKWLGYSFRVHTFFKIIYPCRHEFMYHIIPFLIRVYGCCIILFKEKEIRVKNRFVEYALVPKDLLFFFQIALHPSHTPIHTVQGKHQCQSYQHWKWWTKPKWETRKRSCEVDFFSALLFVR